LCSNSEWRKAQEGLEGIRPYEDGYNKETVNRLIEEGDKLQKDLLEALRVGWDCNCGRGWYDIKESENILWGLMEKYGLDEIEPDDFDELEEDS